MLCTAASATVSVSTVPATRVERSRPGLTQSIAEGGVLVGCGPRSGLGVIGKRQAPPMPTVSCLG